MDRDDRVRWLIAAAVVVAIVWLLIFARGNAHRGLAQEPSTNVAQVVAGWIIDGH